MLRAQGLLARFDALTPTQQQAALRGEVHVGDPVFMAWVAFGPPQARVEVDPLPLAPHQPGELAVFVRCAAGWYRGRAVDPPRCNNRVEVTVIRVVDDTIADIAWPD